MNTVFCICVVCILRFIFVFLYFCISCSAVEFVIGITERNQVLFQLFIRLQKVCMVTINDRQTNFHLLLIKKLNQDVVFLAAKKWRDV